jgi:hypothetical protein
MNQYNLGNAPIQYYTNLTLLEEFASLNHSESMKEDSKTVKFLVEEDDDKDTDVKDSFGIDGPSGGDESGAIKPVIISVLYVFEYLFY